MIHGLFREINESLAKQLAYTVCFRRLRFLYQRRHQQKLENRRRTYNIPEQVTSLPRQNDLVYRTQSEILHRLPQNHPGVSPASWDGLSRTDHSTLDPTKFQGDAPETRSVASGTALISSIGQDYKYPPPPKPKELAESCSCPWCFEELKVSQLATPGWWRYVHSLSSTVLSKTFNERKITFQQRSGAIRMYLRRLHGATSLLHVIDCLE
jgi:hypothetical protein